MSCVELSGLGAFQPMLCVYRRQPTCSSQQTAAFEVLRGGVSSVGACWEFMAEHLMLQQFTVCLRCVRPVVYGTVCG